MAKYNLEALKEKINSLGSSGKKSGDGKAKLNWWKPEIGTHEVRFLPLSDKEGNASPQPFYEVAYYDNKELSEKRFVSPSQYGKRDPLKEVALELAKDRSREAWEVRKKLTPKERYYAAIVVRGDEEEKKGLQIWELSPKLCKDIYTLLVQPDYADEDMFSVDSGFDFTVTVTATDKTFNGYVVKDIKLLPRRKSSKLFPKKDMIEAVLKSIPDFEAFFSAQLKTEEELLEIRDNFLAAQSEEPGEVAETGTSRGSTNSEKATADVNSAFADLDT